MENKKEEGRYSLFMVTIDVDHLKGKEPLDASLASEDIFMPLKPYCKDIVGQLEKGKIEQKLHFQLAIRTTKQIRLTTLRNKLKANPQVEDINKWTFIPIQTTFADAMAYCTKEDTRVGERIVYGTMEWSLKEEQHILDDPDNRYPLAAVGPVFVLQRWDF